MKATYKDIRESFYTFSGKASDAARQLAFAGIAVVWLFNKPRDAAILLPGALLVALFFFVTALALDLIHYAVGSLIWDELTKRHAGQPDDTEIAISMWRDACISTFFVLKLVAVFAGYAILILHLHGIIRSAG
jgi:hypothetical protein